MGGYQEIKVFDTSGTAHIKAMFEQHVDTCALESYRLPVESTQTRVVVGMSGGADSTVLALFVAAYLMPHYPDVKFLFCDTGAEPESCHTTLDKTEALCGISIERIMPEHDLFDLIEKYNGFLPGSRARYCTTSLKVDPITEYVKNNKCDQGVINLAGIRADEANREGITFQVEMENGRNTGATSAFPFVDLGITKTAVFDILSKSVGIPSTYSYRSRSGCYTCFFQRRQEYIGMYSHDLGNFMKTEALEKLTPEDEARWNVMPETVASAGIRAYYPVPDFIDIRKAHDATELPAPKKARKAKDNGTNDMFGGVEEAQRDTLYVAFALYVHPGLSNYGGRAFTPGTYGQELVTLSTSLAGIKSALGTYYSFKRTTPSPIHDVKHMKIVIAQVDFKLGVIDVKAPAKDSYTWKSKESMMQLRNLITNCQNVLQIADFNRQIEDAKSIIEGAKNIDDYLDAEDTLERLEDVMGRVPASQGELVWEGLYTPSLDVEEKVQLQLDGVSIDTDITKAREGFDHDEVPMACMACSI